MKEKFKCELRLLSLCKNEGEYSLSRRSLGRQGFVILITLDISGSETPEAHISHYRM